VGSVGVLLGTWTLLPVSGVARTERRLYRCTRGHLLEWPISYGKPKRCTAQVRLDTDLQPGLRSCRCGVQAVRTRALLAAYKLGGLPAAMDLVDHLPAPKPPRRRRRR
jgi:hypothetical protein